MSVQTYTEDELIDMPEADRNAAIEAMMAESGGEPGAVTNEGNPDEVGTPEVAEPNVAAGDPPADGVAATTAAPAAPAATEDAGNEPGATPVQIAPVFVVEAPQDVDAKLEALKADKLDLRAKYDAGEITFDQYEDGKEAIAEQAAEIKQSVFEANLAGRMEEQRQQNMWKATCEAFTADKVYSTSPRLLRLLDLEVRDVAVSDAGKNMTGVQILAQAHKNLMEAGLVGGATAPAAAPAKPAAKPAPNAPLPPNLALVPAADVSETGGKWTNLARLAADKDNYDAYETALMSLSDADRESFLRSNA